MVLGNDASDCNHRKQPRTLPKIHLRPPLFLTLVMLSNDVGGDGGSGGAGGGSRFLQCDISHKGFGTDDSDCNLRRQPRTRQENHWYYEADMRTGKASYWQLTSLQAFWPDLQVLVGDVGAANSSHREFFIYGKSMESTAREVLAGSSNVAPD